MRVIVLAWLTVLGALAFLSGCAGEGGPEGTGQNASSFTHPTECSSCHPRQYSEWQGAMMAYAATSPVFNALEAVGNELTGGRFAADGEAALFCQKCHAPVSVALGEFPSYAETRQRASSEFMGEVGRHGLSCDFCHQVAHADPDASLLGDGIGNAAFFLLPGRTKFGPFGGARPSPFHETSESSYLRSSEFCGSCHDVRPTGTDVVIGEPFLRLENLFTEWEQGPYATSANPHGRVITCQDCHMSAYPYAPPGTYFTGRAAEYGELSLRRVSTHYFTGVDVALVDFPGQDDPRIDAHGIPIGQAQRREDLLRAACEIEIDAPEAVAAGSVLPLTIAITNVGAGHNVPSGFSQERQIWIELAVRDATDTVLYQSGYLVDRAHPETGEVDADGRLDDEDLQNLHIVIDPETMEAEIEHGPDYDQRPARNLGLVNFGNEFKRLGGGGLEEVFMPFLANHMDNSHSIPPLETARAAYDVPLPAGVPGPLRVSARLRFRAFPPRFLRALAQARPDLVDEVLVDRSLVVDMAEAERTVAIAGEAEATGALGR